MRNSWLYGQVVLQRIRVLLSVHRLTGKLEGGGRMFTNGKELALKIGPGREEMFDSARLGPSVKELRVVDFWGEERDGGARHGSALRVEIEGLYRAGDHGREWFFWGTLKAIKSGPDWVPAHEAKTVCHVFGRWNTHHRTGKIIFGETSFFQDPFKERDA